MKNNKKASKNPNQPISSKIMQSTYTDGILNIAVTGNLIRIDLGIMTPQIDSNGKKTIGATQTQQIVMPIDGFIRAMAMQEKVMQKLVKDGVIKNDAQENTNKTNTVIEEKAGDNGKISKKSK